MNKIKINFSKERTPLMDRTSKFIKIIKKSENQVKPNLLKETFYDQLVKELEILTSSIDNTLSYTLLLKKEQTLANIHNSILLLDRIELQTNNDEQLHFEGIKKIILRRVKQTQQKIQTRKNQFVAQNIEVRPERSLKTKNLSILETKGHISAEKRKGDSLKVNKENSLKSTKSEFLETRNYDSLKSRKGNSQKSKCHGNLEPRKNSDSFNDDLEPKNDEEEGKYYDKTWKQSQRTINKSKSVQKSLQEIQGIQNMITTHLVEQDERIDQIINVIPNCDVIKIDKKGSQHFLRRFITVFIHCSSFMLLFVHFFNK